MLIQWTAMWLFADCSFYWLHRAVHWNFWYAYIHKRHHEFHQTIGLTANYTGIIEGFGVNFVSTFGCIWLIPNIHPITFWLFVGLRVQESIEEHSGYWWPTVWSLLRDNDHHDFHHSHNMGAYGTFPFWDKLMGTDAEYNKFRLEKKQLAERSAQLKKAV